jgi:single-stranded-DNA-specific exonuclease
MGIKFQHWQHLSPAAPQNLDELVKVVHGNRSFLDIAKLEYGDHGLDDAHAAISAAIKAGKRIALYADYDVDGTMSCVSWCWFLKGIGYNNFCWYIPDRFKEGYGLNLAAIQRLIDEERAEVIITMDTGITANAEAAYCKERGVTFICTDHHKIQPAKMPDCVILNPKVHPDENYQELCGAGITFVLLRKLGRTFSLPPEIWIDILALAGMATVCDVVPLNAVNHRLVRMGVDALVKSKREVFRVLLQASAADEGVNEQDIGFRLGPRINAVGRLHHAGLVVKAFTEGDPTELVAYMGKCNEQRRIIQQEILLDAKMQAGNYNDSPILFMGGSWHQGVVGIAASKIAEEFWRPTWLFQRGENQCKGSARSIAGFDVTDAMTSCADIFEKFGGHRAAGGFAFHPKHEDEIRKRLADFAWKIREENPGMWESRRTYDCELPLELVSIETAKRVHQMRPFGHGFEEPVFQVRGTIQSISHLNDKKTGAPKHTVMRLWDEQGRSHKVMFFNEVHGGRVGAEAQCLATISVNRYMGRESAELYGVDLSL